MKILILMLCLVAGPVWAIDDVGAVSCEKFIEAYRTDKWESVKFEYHNYLKGAEHVAERFARTSGGIPVSFMHSNERLFDMLIDFCDHFNKSGNMKFKDALSHYIREIR
jgi:hypothetical protein